MSDYGPAMTYVTILLTLGVMGLIWGMCLPLIDTLLTIGAANIGCDSATLSVLHDSFYVWLPASIIISSIVWAWRKSNQQRIA
jgi:hypothetical protein